MRKLCRWLNPFYTEKGVKQSHVAAFIAGAFLMGSVAGVFGTLGVQHARAIAGGYKPGPLPPQIRMGGGVLPPSYSLDRFVVRVHNQGDDNSCVTQTAATMLEIRTAEKHKPVSLSPSFIWNRLNGGANVPMSFNEVFDFTTTHGVAPLRLFPYDGTPGTWGIYPPVIPGAWKYRNTSWRSIATWDWRTIEAEIHAGRPIAIALPVLDSMYNLWNSPTLPTISSQSGVFHFYHVVTGIGYTPYGVEVLNSWGPGWGRNGRALLTWGYLSAASTGIVATVPHVPHKAKPKIPKVHQSPLGSFGFHRSRHV